ncbi:MAG: hypothetical protein LQ350_005702 [Teloschistes chrysophthalmus]|nr:MAG: hypothetical protein LQ350_005702 [Niorma chrysophthalma]
MSLDPASLVSYFCALPRHQFVPSGSVPNVWHFSIRHVPLSPPGSILFLVNPPSEYVHVAGPLPEAFHMESLPMRANLITLLLLKAFVSELGNSVQMGRPWEWKTDDAELAGAIGECLRGMGIRDGLDAVGVIDEESGRSDEEHWTKFLAQLEGTVQAHRGPQ